MYLVYAKYLPFIWLWSLGDTCVGFIFIYWGFRDRFLGLGCLRYYLWQWLEWSRSCGKQSQETLVKKWGRETGRGGDSDHCGQLEFSPAGVFWVTRQTLCLRVIPPNVPGIGGVYSSIALSPWWRAPPWGLHSLTFLAFTALGHRASDAPRPRDAVLTLRRGAHVHWNGERQEEISRVLAASATKYPHISLVFIFPILPKIVFHVCKSGFHLSIVGKVYKCIRK